MAVAPVGIGERKKTLSGRRHEQLRNEPVRQLGRVVDAERRHVHAGVGQSNMRAAVSLSAALAKQIRCKLTHQQTARDEWEVGLLLPSRRSYPVYKSSAHRAV